MRLAVFPMTSRVTKISQCAWESAFQSLSAACRPSPISPHMTRQSSHTALLWIVAVGFFMQALDTTIVNTALPSIARSLNAAPLALQSIVVAYTLTMALFTPASGWLADRFGTRRVYFVAIALFVLGSLAC